MSSFFCVSEEDVDIYLDENSDALMSTALIGTNANEDINLHPTVSFRARKLIAPPLPYISKLIEQLDNQYHPEANPEGSILLCTAENKLCSDLLFRKISHVTQTLPPYILNYTTCSGLKGFRHEISKFFTQYLFKGHYVNPDHLFVGSGCVALLTSLSLNLFDHNDSVLIPVPYYPAFDHDFLNFAGVHVLPIFGEQIEDEVIGSSSAGVFEAPEGSNPFGYLTENALENAYNDAIMSNNPPKAILLTNPNNPIGYLYTERELRTVIAFSKKKGIHLILDEIYALSVFPEYSQFEINGAIAREESKYVVEQDEGRLRYRSIVELVDGDLGDFMHFVWSFSKDFAASGLRVGVLYTQNQSLLSAMSATNEPMMSSNLTQYTFQCILHDRTFLHNYFAINSERLHQSYCYLKHFLEQELDVRVLPAAQGAIFAFCDFRKYVDPQNMTYLGEYELFEKIIKKAKIVLTPGESCHCPIPGFFRVCYAFVTFEALIVGLARLKEALLTSIHDD